MLFSITSRGTFAIAFLLSFFFFIFFSSSVAQAQTNKVNLVENGSFERHGWLYYGGWGYFRHIPAWRTKQGYLEVQAYGISGVHAIDGHKVLEPDSAYNSHVYTSIPTQKGRQYKLSFFYSPRVEEKGTDTNDVEVWWGNEKIAKLTGTQRQWEKYAYTVTANSAKTKLAFVAVGKSDSRGGLIDHVHVEPLKETVSCSTESVLINGSFEDDGLKWSNYRWQWFHSIPGWRSFHRQFEIQKGSVSGINAQEGVHKQPFQGEKIATTYPPFLC